MQRATTGRLQQARPGVVVLGMHRSGTSAATRLVTLLGPRPPRSEDLVPPSTKNPTGYWESMSLVSMNERILWAVGSDVRWPARLAAGWEGDGRFERLRAEAPPAFRSTFPGEPWVWKDPRTCLTFSFWRRSLQVAPAVVLVNRNPLEVVESSLRSRRAEGKRYLLALWERYLRQALSQIGGLPVLVTSYERLLAEPLRWCDQVSSFLRRAEVPLGAPDEAEVLRFVDTRLRHVELGRQRLLEDPDVSASQRELVSVLERLDGPHDSFVAPELLPETATVDALLADRRRALEREREAVVVEGRLARRARRLARLFS